MRSGRRLSPHSCCAAVQRLFPAAKWATEGQIKTYLARLKAQHSRLPNDGSDDDELPEEEEGVDVDRDNVIAEVLDEVGEPHTEGETCPHCGKTGLRRLRLHLTRWCKLAQ